MSRTKLLTIAVIGLLLINLGTLTFLLLRKPGHGDGPPNREKPTREGPKRIIIERLHFDQTQIDSYEKLILQHRTAVRVLEDSLRETRNALYATLSNPAEGKNDSLQTQLGHLQHEIEAVHYDHFQGIKKICRPEQMQYFNDLTKELARFFAPEGNRPPPNRP